MVELLPNSLPLLVFIAGIVLTAAEAVLPGAHFIVLGIALMTAGLLALLLGPVFGPLASPLGIALVTLIMGAVTFWGYRNLNLYGGRQSGQTADVDSLKGAEGRVTETVTRGGGEVKLKDGGFNPFYRARSMDQEIPEGTRVMVIDPGGGNVVTVTPTEEFEDDIDRELAAERASQKREERLERDASTQEDAPQNNATQNNATQNDATTQDDATVRDDENSSDTEREFDTEET